MDAFEDCASFEMDCGSLCKAGLRTRIVCARFSCLVMGVVIK